jgi:hypothetical protein
MSACGIIKREVTSMAKQDTAYKNQFIAEKYDRINLTVPKGDKERIHAYAASMGKSVNAYINDLIKADMDK